MEFQYSRDRDTAETYGMIKREALLDESPFIGKKIDCKINEESGVPRLIVRDEMNRSINHNGGNIPIGANTPGVTSWNEVVIDLDGSAAAQNAIEKIVSDKVEDTIQPYRHKIDLFNPMTDINDSNNFVVMSESAAEVIDSFVYNIDNYGRDFDGLTSVSADPSLDSREFIEYNDNISTCFTRINMIRNEIIKHCGVSVEHAKLSPRDFLNTVIKNYGHTVSPDKIKDLEKYVRAYENQLSRKNNRENEVISQGYKELSSKVGGIVDYAKIDRYENSEVPLLQQPKEQNGVEGETIILDTSSFTF